MMFWLGQVAVGRFFVRITKRHDLEGHASDLLLLAMETADIIKMIT